MTQLSTRRRVYAEAHMLIHDNERYFDDYMVHETHKPPRRLPGPATAELRKLWLLRPKPTMIRGGSLKWNSERVVWKRRFTSIRFVGKMMYWSSARTRLRFQGVCQHAAHRQLHDRFPLSQDVGDTFYKVIIPHVINNWAFL
ncbi:hypothetical protein MCOR10_003557 [Pyricularia oryzae]|nr:hypothetical protein MCOR10_003557 [Pyricularia oryzae]